MAKHHVSTSVFAHDIETADRHRAFLALVICVVEMSVLYMEASFMTHALLTVGVFSKDIMEIIISAAESDL